MDESRKNSSSHKRTVIGKYGGKLQAHNMLATYSMWKLLSGILSEKMYYHLETEQILPEEQKGCRKGSRGTKDQLLIDKMVLRNCKHRKTNLAMAWIDFRKTYDMVPHSWILETLKLTGIASNVQRLVRVSIANWKTVLTSNGQTLGEAKIQRGIFQGDSLSPQ